MAAAYGPRRLGRSFNIGVRASRKRIVHARTFRRRAMPDAPCGIVRRSLLRRLFVRAVAIGILGPAVQQTVAAAARLHSRVWRRAGKPNGSRPGTAIGRISPADYRAGTDCEPAAGAICPYRAHQMSERYLK